ncbi:MAG: phosphatase PAP2 family protein, partial [Myxococcota bacterium]
MTPGDRNGPSVGFDLWNRARAAATAVELPRRVPLALTLSMGLLIVYVGYAALYGDARHVLGALLVFGGLLATGLAARMGRPGPAVGRLVQAGYPLLFWPILYQQAVETVMLTPHRYVDPVLLRFDAVLFGWPHGVPTTALLGGPIEELANAFYTSYYVGIPVGFFWLFRQDPDQARRYGTAVLTAFAGCALIWLVIPSGGLHPTGGPTGAAFGPFTEVARMVYATNPHYAAAFPSSHVALATAAATTLHLSGRGRVGYLWAAGIA